MSDERTAAEIYADIIDIPHPEPRHPRMAAEARAAQFASFAALSGYEEAIADTTRAVAEKYEADVDTVSNDDML